MSVFDFVPIDTVSVLNSILIYFVFSGVEKILTMREGVVGIKANNGRKISAFNF